MLELTLFKRALQCCNVVNISFQSRRFSHVVYDEALERSSRLPIYFISLFISSLLIFFFSFFSAVAPSHPPPQRRRRDPTFISIVYAVSPSLNSLTEEENYLTSRWPDSRCEQLVISIVNLSKKVRNFILAFNCVLHSATSRKGIAMGREEEGVIRLQIKVEEEKKV